MEGQAQYQQHAESRIQANLYLQGNRVLFYRESPGKDI